jgi:SAM-dependent methyltransferase
MSVKQPILETPTGSAVRGPDVWQRVWRHPVSPERDDALIRREERSTRWRQIETVLIETFGRLDGLRAIELGAGRGDVSLLLAARGAAVTLLDYSPAALDQARARFARWDLPADYIRRNLLDAAAICGADYDVSLSLGVAEHFRGHEREAVIRAHRAVLRPGGMAVISVPHAACPTYRLWKMYLELRGWWPYGMEIPYSRRELTRSADAAGFGRRRVTCSGFLQSVGDHLGKTFWGRSPRWTDRPCFLDDALGMTLTLFAWNVDRDSAAGRRAALQASS